MNVTPDGARYLAIGEGRRVPLPFHLRWLPCKLGGNREYRWRAIQVLSCLAIAGLLAVFLHQHGLTPTQIAAGVALAALLGGVGRTFLVFPIIVDPTAQAFALGAAVALNAGWWPLAIALALAAGASKEWAPAHAAVWAWNPILLVGLVAPLLRACQRPGPDLASDVPMRPQGPSWPSFDRRWLDPTFVALPWGVCLAALLAPSWQLAAALGVAYGGLVVVEILGLPMGSTSDCSRVYQWAYPVVILAALTVIPTPWLLIAVTFAALNPWGRGPFVPKTPKGETVITSKKLHGVVAIGYCSGGQLEDEMAESLHSSYVHDWSRVDSVLAPEPIRIKGGPRLHYLRDILVRRFLDDTSCEWLLCPDTDMEWEPEAIHQLLASADPVERPIVGGLCFGSGRSGGKLFPTIFRWDGTGFETLLDYERDALVECDATGWAFILVHRSVLEHMRDAYSEAGDDLQPWFPDGQVGDHVIEGDMAFCLRARNLGYRIFVNTAVKVRHKKSQFLDEPFYDLVAEIQGAKA